MAMAGEWIECTLADACSSVDYGLTASASKCDLGPKFLRITDIVTGHIDWKTVPHVAADEATISKYRLNDGDIVVARTGASTGASAYVKNPPMAVFASYLVRLQVKPEFEARFISYYLQSEDFWTFIRGVLGDKSAQPNASAATMTKAPLRAPKDKDEQRAIAHILGTLDDKIELNRRMSETLEQMARALFKAWFVDFEPVRAKMDGRWHRGESLPGLPAHLYDLFPDRLVSSELGEIPEGWGVARLGEVFEINPLRRLRKGQVAPYLDMASMPTRGHRPLEVVPRAFSSGSRFINGDTLLARITPCLENGKTAFVDFLQPGEVGWGSTEFIVLHPKPPLPPEFGYCLARHPDFREFAIQSMTGTSGRQRVQPEALALYQLAVPPEAVARAFGQIVQPLFAQASHAYNESRTLAALRDALLPKLVRGEIRVKDVEKLVLQSVPNIQEED
jgi:type I restriction enzyme S subunit